MAVALFHFFLYKLKYVFHSFTLVLGFKVSKVATVVRVYGKVTHEKLLFFPYIFTIFMIILY